MLEKNDIIEMQEQNGADDSEINIFCYVAYYPYLNA